METNTKTKSSAPKMNLIKERSFSSSYKEKTNPHTIIIIMGIVFSTILFLAKISWIHMNWRIPFIPLMLALQIIFLSTALKKRFKKL
jgi:CHASE2 domain-containing sensor protein